MSDEKSEVEIDKVKAARIMHKIILSEKRNLNSKQIPDMVKAIQKMIEEEIQCF